MSATLSAQPLSMSTERKLGDVGEDGDDVPDGMVASSDCGNAAEGGNTCNAEVCVPAATTAAAAAAATAATASCWAWATNATDSPFIATSLCNYSHCQPPD